MIAVAQQATFNHIREKPYAIYRIVAYHTFFCWDANIVEMLICPIGDRNIHFSYSFKTRCANLYA